jgi:hypothetical protein
MKNIQPVQTWHNGQLKTASVLVARIISDDMNSTCTFYYELKEADVTVEITPVGGGESTENVTYGMVLSNGNVTLSAELYMEWDGSNEYAYQFIANELNLVLI